MAKYDPLFEHLCRAGDGPLDLTFDDVARLVGGLPASAESYRAWWANEVGPRHPQVKAWLNAGREVVSVDIDGRVVRFSAARWTRGA